MAGGGAAARTLAEVEGAVKNMDEFCITQYYKVVFGNTWSLGRERMCSPRRRTEYS